MLAAPPEPTPPEPEPPPPVEQAQPPLDPLITVPQHDTPSDAVLAPPSKPAPRPPEPDPGVLARAAARKKAVPERREQQRAARAEARARDQAQAETIRQLDFRTLIVPAAATVLLGGEPVALGLGDLRIVLCPTRAVPRAVLRCARSPAPDAAESFASLLDDHLAPFIAAVCRVARLSERMVWENAAWPLAFALRQAIDRSPACLAAVDALLARLTVPSAARSALTAVRRTVLHGAAFERRLCCLRHHLPGLCPCAGQCPRIERSTAPDG